MLAHGTCVENGNMIAWIAKDEEGVLRPKVFIVTDATSEGYMKSAIEEYKRKGHCEVVKCEITELK